VPVPQAQVITLASPTAIPEGNVVGFDDDNDTPLVVAYTGKPAISGAHVVEIADAGPGPGGGIDSADLTAHIVDSTPHPAYDDLPSLTLLFQNGLI
jgi:hypothetical protein